MLNSNTLLDVVNSALLAAGDRCVEALDDANDKTSMQASALVRQAVMDVQAQSSRPWRELWTVKKLVLREQDPLWGEWCFNKPTDCLSVVAVGTESRDTELHFREEGNMIWIPVEFLCPRAAREGAVLCRYSRLSMEPSEWGADLRGCVISLLTARLSGVLSATPAVAQNLEEKFWKEEFVRRTANSIVNTEGAEGYAKGRHAPEYY